MTIEDLFGTLQQSVVSSWRKHLKTHKYSNHMALNDFYEEMPEKVDALIEAWMGVNGKKVKSFNNIVKASNMGTLKYLKELRSVCKQGYSLMNGEKELEALLDDIVELIDSTLYKIKELSENKNIKTLKDFINESLVNEAAQSALFYLGTYDDLNVIVGSPADLKKCEKQLKNDGFNCVSQNLKNNMCGVMWNDETISAWDLKGNNWKAVQAEDAKNIETMLKDRKVDYVYLESEIFGSGNEWEDEEARQSIDWSPKFWVEVFIEMVENSYVDGDSNYCRAVLDLAKKGICCQGENDINICDASEYLKR